MSEMRFGHLRSPLNIPTRACEKCEAGAVISLHRRNQDSKRQTDFIQPTWVVGSRGRIGAQVITHILWPSCDSRRLWGWGGTLQMCLELLALLCEFLD